MPHLQYFSNIMGAVLIVDETGVQTQISRKGMIIFIT